MRNITLISVSIFHLDIEYCYSEMKQFVQMHNFRGLWRGRFYPPTLPFKKFNSSEKKAAHKTNQQKIIHLPTEKNTQ